MTQHVCATAQSPDGRHVVTHEQNSPSISRYVSHFAQTFFLESNIADGQYFIDHQYFRFEVGGNSKRQPDVHSAGIMFNRRVDELCNFGEVHDIVEFASYFDALHTQNRTVEVDVLSTCQFRMKPCSYLKQ